MTLGSLLLDWGLDKDTIVEICYLETLGKQANTKSTKLSMVSKKPALVSPKTQSSFIPQASNNDMTRQKTHRSNNDDDDDDNNKNGEDDSGNEDSDSDGGEVAASTADSHVKTVRFADVFQQEFAFDRFVVLQIEYLIERLSALESERRKRKRT